MGKQEFLDRLRKGLSGLPPKEAEERLSFYSEMIDDRMEEGLSEEAAVAAAGSVEGLLAQVTAAPVKTGKGEKQHKPWIVLLLVLGSPVWLPLGIAALAVALSLCISIWAVIISLWSAFGAVAACGVAGVLAGGVLAAGGNVSAGLAVLGGAFICAGLSVFFFLGCKALTKATAMLTGKLVKKCFTKKEVAP